MLQLAVFLGNPGREYRHNRHNAGWMLADALPFAPSLDWQKKFKGLYACLDSADMAARFAASNVGDVPAERPAATPVALPPKFHFLKPQTYMNLSGESVQAAASFFKIKLDEIIVVHDEIELPFGMLSLKFSGGLGGHNGLRSMKASFGSADFWRLRIGIGRPDGRVPGKGGSPSTEGEPAKDNGIAGWVLSNFTAAETEALAPAFNTGAGLLVQALTTGPGSLLPKWAKKNCVELESCLQT
jgi:PTH1 family peptidyl-tRNA hydrolase